MESLDRTPDGRFRRLMPMRQDCRNFESRTYASGETVRKCNLDLAPEAPWRCPENCSGFAPRMDAGWSYGSLVTPRTPDEPPGLDDGSAAAVLDMAEDILNSVGARVLAEVEAERAAKKKRWFRRRRD
jgi:hypothetical protein